MSTEQDYILKGLINRLPEEKRAIYINLLTDKELDFLRKLPAINTEIAPPSAYYVEQIHYSWFIPIITKADDIDALALLSSLEKKQATPLLTHLSIDQPLFTLSNPAKNYFHQLLFHEILPKDFSLLPICFLPESPLNILLNLSKHRLEKLIDYLSIFDLAAHIHQVVEPSILKAIYTHLSKKQRDFLEKKKNYKDFFHLPPLELTKYYKNPPELSRYLHKRGLLRLSGALYLANPHLIWYLCHILDTGRARIIHEMTKEKFKYGENIAKHLLHQIIAVIALIQEEDSQ